MKEFNLGIIKMNMKPNGFTEGLILNRELTTDECRHIMYDLLGINILDADDFGEDEDDYKEYEEYNLDLTNDVNKWLTGEYDDYAIMEYASDCADEPIDCMNLIPILNYLKQNNIID